MGTGCEQLCVNRFLLFFCSLFRLWLVLIAELTSYLANSQAAPLNLHAVAEADIRSGAQLVIRIESMTPSSTDVLLLVLTSRRGLDPILGLGFILLFLLS